MFIYFGKRFDSAQVDACFIGVQCDKCGCKYYYHLARIGTSSSSAPYMIGQGAAANSAEKKSRQEVQRRLASEAELVPCPKCNWINDELIRGYRRGKYRAFTTVAVIGGIIGIISSLLCGWFISIGPPGDRHAAPYFLYGGPALFFSFGMGLLLLRKGMRYRIQPNRHFPQPPKLPPGTPPALLMDQASGELWPATPDASLINNGWLDFQIGRHHLPLFCCDCLKPATTEHSHRIPVSGPLHLEIPRCAACANKPLGASRLGWFIFAAIFLLVAGMAFVLWRYDAGTSGVVNIGLIVLFLVAVPLILMRVKIPGPVEAVIVDRSRGVVKLRFRNAEYGRIVAKQLSETGEIECAHVDFPTDGSSENTHIRTASPDDIKREKTNP
jgi:hypothetical protein